MDTLKYHPLCRLLPAMPEDELDRLVEDIRANGLREAITLCDGQVLDGRSRLAACRMAGVEPRFVGFSGPSAAAFVASMNLHRRHLSASQRAAVAAELAEAMECEAAGLVADQYAFPTKTASTERENSVFPEENTSAPIGAEVPEAPKQAAHRPKKDRTVDAAKVMGAKTRSTQRARKVKQADPELHEAVKAGEITLNAAEEQVNAATAPPDDGEKIRHALLRRLDVAAEIYLLCDSPAGRNVKRSKAIEYHGLLVQTIKGERPAMDPVAEIVLPPPLSGDAFRSKWREWCDYRRAKKKPITKIAAEKQLKKLADVPLADAMQAIDDAIASDYQGVFPKRSAGNGRGRPRDGAGQRFDSDADDAGPGRL